MSGTRNKHICVWLWYATHLVSARILHDSNGGGVSIGIGILSRGHTYEITNAIFYRLASTQTQTYHQKEGEQEIAVQLCSLAQINHLFLQARETQPMAALDFEQRGAPRRLHAPLAH